MKTINVTRRVEFGWPVGDRLSVTRCACQVVFQPGQFVISVHRDSARACPRCGKRLFFAGNIRVYEVRG
ncbi:MAG TPA: hypothetical protein VN364_08220 [Bellilinea sp.]|nr:hypothetical protein [Bellilinea sp.]